MIRRAIISLIIILPLLSSPDIFGPVPSGKNPSGKTTLKTTKKEYTLVGIVFSQGENVAFFLHTSGKYLVLREGQGSKKGLKLVSIRSPFKVIVLLKGKRRELSIPLKGGKNEKLLF